MLWPVTVLGALVGGLLLDFLPRLNGSAYVALFVCSGILRFAAALIFPRAVREVRAVRPGGLREIVYDMAGQRLVGILWFLPAARRRQGAVA